MAGFINWLVVGCDCQIGGGMSARIRYVPRFSESVPVQLPWPLPRHAALGR